MRKSILFILMITLLTSCASQRIRIVGPSVFVLEAGQPYLEPGVSLLSGESAKLAVSSDLNPQKPGTYRMRYLLVDGKEIVAQTSRKIKVVDTTPPALVLNGKTVTDVCPGQNYADEGARAIDLVDGDLTSSIKITSEEGKLTYHVADTAGNSVSLIREIHVRDIDAPVFDASDEISVLEGGQLPNIVATDRCEGDLSALVTTDKIIDTSVVGDQTLTYSVVDSKGNAATFTQVIHVKKSHSASTIFLTFDDGPSYLTDDFLDLLAEFDVKATFFINKKSGYDTIIQRAYREGHSIGMHSYSHVYSRIYASEDAFFQDLYAEQAWIKNLTGETSRLYRFPGGSSNTVSNFNPGIMTLLTQSIREKGIQYFDWNLSSGDAGKHDAEFITNYVLKQLGSRSNYVMLMHDSGGHESTLEALRNILTYAKQEGYSFSALNVNSHPAHHGVKN